MKNKGLRGRSLVEEIKRQQQRPKILEEALRLFVATLGRDPSVVGPLGVSAQDPRTLSDVGVFPSQVDLEKHFAGVGYEPDALVDVGLLDARLGKSHKIALPYRNARGELLGFFAASTDGAPSFLTDGATRSSLYGIHEANGTTRLTLFPDPLAALLARLRGLVGAVAIGGEDFDDVQLYELGKIRRLSLIVGLRNGAEEEVERIVDRMTGEGLRSYVAPISDPLPNGAELEKTLRGAESAAKFKARRLLSKHGLQSNAISVTQDLRTQISDAQRDEIIDEALTFANDFPDRLEVEDFLGTITKALGLSPDILPQKLAGYHEKRAKERFLASARDVVRKAEDKLVEGDAAGVEEILKGEASQLRASVSPILPLPYTLERLEHDIKLTPEGLKTGYPALDRFLGIQSGALTIVAGRPSHGKTSLLMNVALNQAKTYSEKTFLFFSYEESSRQIALKLLNILSGDVINAASNLGQLENYVRGGSTARKKIEDGKATLRNYLDGGRLIVVDTPLLADELVDAIQRYGDRYDVGGVFVDYIQKVKILGKFPTRQVELQRISETLLEGAKRLNVPIVLGAQFNRAAGDEPKLEHLREAGDIEQDANAVLGLFNPAMERAQNNGETLVDPEVELKVTLLKNRNGAVNEEVRLKFYRPTLKISEAVL